MSEEPVSQPRRATRWPVILIILGIVVIALGAFWWWLNRPIQPVVLSPQEKAVVEAKIAAIQNSGQPDLVDSANSINSTNPASADSAAATNPAPAEPAYERGKKEIVLTEREVNGLLNANTDLGKTVSFQFGTDVIVARIETPLDPDLPLIGGHTFKARARFIVSEGSGHPSFVIDDLTVWGISIPNDWLGGLKGRNLFEEVFGIRADGNVPGVESFSIKPGQITVKLME